MEKQSDLIAARATPDSVSAIAVVRLSGRGASKAVELLMGLEEGRLSGMKRVLGDFRELDQVVAISWPEGRSYTGEEMVDIMCHGTPGTPGAILDLLMKNGARPADPGEFTRRAWLNGRVTETDILLLSARFRNLPVSGIGELEEKLKNTLAETEALIEFGEEHEIADSDSVESCLIQAERALNDLRISKEQIEILPRTYIMGPVNAGKSTLFNRICGETAAVVSEIPGTTRDGASRRIDVRGRHVEVYDTAGTGGKSLDGSALAIALRSMRSTDRIVWMDPEEKEPEQDLVDGRKILLVSSKNERENNTGGKWLPCSSHTGKGLEEIKVFISSSEENSPSWRLLVAEAMMKEAMDAWKNSDMALSAEILRQVMETVNCREKNADAVERALEMFCVGK